MAKIKLECVLADTCLSDYWCGHHKAHICTPVSNKTTMKQLKQDLLNELAYAAVAGSDSIAESLSQTGTADPKKDEAVLKAAKAAVRRLRLQPPARKPFPDLEDEADESVDSVYAYFVFVILED